MSHSEQTDELGAGQLGQVGSVTNKVTEWAGILEEAPAAEVLTWAADQFAPRLTFATGFGAEGCVLIDLIAREQLKVDLFTLDTGLLFPETITLWRQLEARYGVIIRPVRPASTVEQQARREGPELWAR